MPQEVIAFLNAQSGAVPFLPCGFGCGAPVLFGAPGEPCPACYGRYKASLCGTCDGSGRVLNDYRAADEFTGCPDCGQRWS